MCSRDFVAEMKLKKRTAFFPSVFSLMIISVCLVFCLCCSFVATVAHKDRHTSPFSSLCLCIFQRNNSCLNSSPTSLCYQNTQSISWTLSYRQMEESIVDCCPNMMYLHGTVASLSNWLLMCMLTCVSESDPNILSFDSCINL